MKLSTKIILPIILISALLISLSGCIIPTVTPSPGETTTGGTITGTFETPEACCMSNRDHTEGWVPLVNATVSVIDSKGVAHTTKTDSDGKYWLTDVAPGIYYVVTACCECEDREGVYKDVVEEKLKEGDTYDAGIADCESTALGLMVDYLLSGDVFVEEDCNCYCNCFDEESQIYASLVTTGVKLRVAAINLLNPATKPLDKIRANADFQGFVVELCDLLEACCVEPGAATTTGGTTTVKKFTLTTSVDPPGSGTITREVGGVVNNGPYNPGTIVTIEAINNPGYEFINWTVDASGINPITKVTMNSNKAVIAHFNCPLITGLEINIGEEERGIERSRDRDEEEPITLCLDECAIISSVTVYYTCTPPGSLVITDLTDDSLEWTVTDEDGYNADHLVDLNLTTNGGTVCLHNGLQGTLGVYTINVIYTDPCGEIVSDDVMVEFKDCSCPELDHIDLLPDVTANVCEDDCFTFTEVKLYYPDGTTVLETIALPDLRVELTHSGAVNDLTITDIAGGVQVCLKDGCLNTPYTITATYTDSCDVEYTATEVITFELCCPYISHIDLLPDGPIVLCPDTCFTFTEVKLYDPDGTTVLETIALPDSRVGLTSNGGTNIYITDITGGVEVCLADAGIPDAYTITATYTDICGTYTDEECVDFKVCNLPDQLTINSYTNPGPDTHYFEVNVTVSGTDYDVSDGNYFGWCCDLANTGFISGTVRLFCSYWEGQDGQGIWPKINYIINNYHTGESINGSTIAMMDIQSAIWKFTNPALWALYSHLHTEVAGLIYDDAYFYGAGFCPAIGQLYAAAFPRNIRCHQNLFIEVIRDGHCPE